MTPLVDLNRAADADIRVTVVRDPAAFAALRTEWGMLMADSDAGLFNSWEWLHTWHRTLAPERALRILAARAADGTLVGLMPLAIERRRAAGRRIRRLAFLGETHVGSDYLDIIARRGMRGSVTRALAAALQAGAADWDVLDLLDLDSRSSVPDLLREAFGDRWRVSVTPRDRCPYEPLPPVGFAEFLKTRRRADNFQRRRKWLEAQPGFAVEIASAPEAIAAPMADFFRLHMLRWREEGGSAGIPDREVEGFHRAVMPLLAERGALRLFTLRVGGESVASVYGLRDRRRFLYYQAGYHPAWRNRSVGLVLVGETFRDSLAGNLTEFDFLRGLETYKSDWVTAHRNLIGLRIHRKFGAGAWLGLHERLRSVAKIAVKGLVPSGLLARLRGRPAAAT